MNSINLREAAQQALEALTASNDLLVTMYLKMDAIAALRAVRCPRRALAQENCVYTIKNQDGFGTEWRTGCGDEMYVSTPDEVGVSSAPMPNPYGKYCRFCSKLIEVKK